MTELQKNKDPRDCRLQSHKKRKFQNEYTNFDALKFSLRQQTLVHVRVSEE